MVYNKGKFALILLLSALIGAAGSVLASADKLDVDKITRITGMKGEWNESEGVLKLSVPRTDLNVAAAGVKMTPALGLTAWAAFQKAGESAMVMGDIVMTEGQVNDVLSAALDSGLEVTALHNHFFGDSPKIMFMHIAGNGGEEQLATAVRNVLEALKATAAKRLPLTSIDPKDSHLPVQKLGEILGVAGTLKDGVFKVVVGRMVKMHGVEIGSAMGINSWAAFAGNEEQAVVDGDIMASESALQYVLKVLRQANINIVAIHNHMTMEKPRTIFIHYWGTGPVVQLAKGIKAAMAVQKY